MQKNTDVLGHTWWLPTAMRLGASVLLLVLLVFSDVAVRDSHASEIIDTSESHPFSQILSRADKIRYRYLMQASKEGSWDHFDNILSHVQDPILVGFVLYHAYVHGDSYRASQSELKAWLHCFADRYPEAKQVKALLKSRKEGSAPCRLIKAHDAGDTASSPGVIFYPERFDEKSFSSEKFEKQGQDIDSTLMQESSASIQNNPNNPLPPNVQGGIDKEDQPFLNRSVIVAKAEMQIIRPLSWQKQDLTLEVTPQDLRLSTYLSATTRNHANIIDLLRQGRYKQAVAIFKKNVLEERYRGFELEAIQASLVEALTLARRYKEAVSVYLTRSQKGNQLYPRTLWWAGLSAYGEKRFQLAEKLFIEHSNYLNIPLAQRLRSLFWGARAAEAGHHPERVHDYLERVGKMPDLTLYGYLSRAWHTLKPQGQTWLLSNESEREKRMISGLDWSPLWPNLAIFDDQKLLRRVIALVEIGEHRLADEHLTKIITTRRHSEDELLTIASFAELLHLPMASIRASLFLFNYHKIFYARGLYPLPFWFDDIPSSKLVDPSLVLALVRQESAFSYRAISKSGARGLMQIMPFTASDVSGRRVNAQLRQDLFLTESNLTWGSKYFDRLLGDRFFSGSLLHSLAAYNGGPTRIKRHDSHNDPLFFMEIISPRETRDYVNYVLINFLIYRDRMDLETEAITKDLVQSRYPRLNLIQKTIAHQ